MYDGAGHWRPLDWLRLITVHISHLRVGRGSMGVTAHLREGSRQSVADPWGSQLTLGRAADKTASIATGFACVHSIASFRGA